MQYTAWPIPMAARSKAWVCGRSVAGIADSNVCCERRVLSGSWLCYGLITRTERGVSEYDLEVSIMNRVAAPC